MGAKKGNKNAKGNKGGGRKSAYQEKADADFLWKMFNEEYTKDEIKKMLDGKRSIKKAWLVKALAGNEGYVKQIIGKIFPDKKEHTGSEGKAIELDVVLKQQIEKVYGKDAPDDIEEISGGTPADSSD